MTTLMRVLKESIAYGFIVSVFILAGCGGNADNKQANAIDSLAKANQQAAAEAEQMIKSFPTPFEITQMLNKAGASYILDLSNSCDNAEKYSTAKSRALNWGIYGADLCYAATYNKKQETTNFLAATQKLVEKLEISNAFDKSVNDRMNKNFDKKDSLINMFTKQFSNTYDILNKSGRSNIAAISIASGTIEGIYISAQLAAFAKDNTELKKVIAGQKETLKKLVSLLSLYKDDKDIQEVFGKVKEVNAIFEGVNETLTDDQLKNLSAKVESIRNEFVK
ncbi:MAG: hypothetical protein HY958_12895 [Bacteroidia bacterium]|nr:hypothetical protein [Bacteroidia bacterium]